MYVCDECRKETNLDAKDKDGRQVCEDCIKKDRRSKSKLPKTNDKLVKFARKYSNIDAGHTCSDVILQSDGGRCYTNGRFIISDIDELPDVHTTMDAGSLEIVERTYPKIERVIPKGKPKFVITIPDDFYKCLNVFKPNDKNNNSLGVDFYEDYIKVSSIDGDMTLEYSEADTSEITEPCRANAKYLMTLKPKIIEIYASNTITRIIYRMRGSYDKFINEFSVIVLSSMRMETKRK